MKTFVLSDNSVNCYGFRVLTSGINLPLFKSNPIMLWMHTRAEKSGQDQILPLGKWSNIRVEDERLLAEPEFDTRDPFAMKIKDKVDAGILKAASIGIGAYTLDDSPALKLPGQTGGTVTKCNLQEASIVDVGANANALALYAFGSPNPLPSTQVRLHMAQLTDIFTGDPLTSDPLFRLTYDELHAGDGMAQLKRNNHELYCYKLYEKFGTMPANSGLPAGTAQRFADLAKKTKLSRLSVLTYDELHRNGQLAELKALDVTAYNWKVAEMKLARPSYA